MKRFKILLWGGLALTVLLAGHSTARAANAAKQITYQIKPSFAGLDADGLKIDLDSSFTNPTQGKFTLRDTVIQIFHQDRELTKLDLSGQAITIRPDSTGMLSDPDQLGKAIRVHVPYDSIKEIAPLALAAKLGFGPPLKLEVRVRTKVKIPFVPAFPFRHTEPFILDNSN